MLPVYAIVLPHGKEGSVKYQFANRSVFMEGDVYFPMCAPVAMDILESNVKRKYRQNAINIKLCASQACCKNEIFNSEKVEDNYLKLI